MQFSDFGPLKESARRILVAEDDAITRRILEHWLSALGFEVTMAEDGNQAWEILQQEKAPELILMDWVMPGIDGIELCRRMRESPGDYYHYILMMTGRSDLSHVVHALQSGADDCLTKPFEQPELKARLSVACRILDLQDQLIEAREHIRLQAMKDALTGLWNRAAFTEMFEQELDRAKRIKGQTGLLLLDLDHFKEVNDKHGHMTGDAVLRKAARMLRESVRAYDFVGRYGGEEFFIAFPNCDAEQARSHAERIRKTVASTSIQVGAEEISVSFSIGTAVAGADQRTIGPTLAAADVALYRAKSSGRNCVVSCRRDLAEVHAYEGRPEDCCTSCDASLATICTTISTLN